MIKCTQPQILLCNDPCNIFIEGNNFLALSDAWSEMTLIGLTLANQDEIEPLSEAGYKGIHFCEWFLLAKQFCISINIGYFNSSMKGSAKDLVIGEKLVPKHIFLQGDFANSDEN